MVVGKIAVGKVLITSLRRHTPAFGCSRTRELQTRKYCPSERFRRARPRTHARVFFSRSSRRFAALRGHRRLVLWQHTVPVNALTRTPQNRTRAPLRGVFRSSFPIPLSRSSGTAGPFAARVIIINPFATTHVPRRLPPRFPPGGS